MQRRCQDYTNAINVYYENGEDWASILDKPNAHRLIELAFHTIPMYGHALNDSELVLNNFIEHLKNGWRTIVIWTVI